MWEKDVSKTEQKVLPHHILIEAVNIYSNEDKTSKFQYFEVKLSLNELLFCDNLKNLDQRITKLTEENCITV